MDVETIAAIETLRDEVNARFDSHDARFDQIDAQLVALDSKFDKLERNTRVLTERVRDDIRIVAEGLATLSAKFDARFR